ncbi:MAG: hypothetical protein JSS66_06760 [Armatimonadetes bacterium]|nr:hypothetical protein [Armatimonadota bacterium]
MPRVVADELVSLKKLQFSSRDRARLLLLLLEHDEATERIAQFANLE